MQIKNFAKIEFLTGFELTKHANEHSHLNFSASIVETAAESCLDCAGKIISVTTNDNAPIFFGRVESVDVENSLGASKVHASCVSLSILSDENIKTRIFHNPDKKFSDVLSDSRLSLESCRLQLSADLAALKYPKVILQNAETNFQFISRLAQNVGQKFWVVDTIQPTNIILDSCTNKSAREIKREQIISERRTKVGKHFKAFVKLKKFYDLGQVVKLEGSSKDFIIVGIKISLEHETYIFYYELEENKTASPKISDAPTLAKTVKLHAKVKSTNDPKNLGRIQVSFDDNFLEDMDEKNPLWIPYRTPYSGKNGGIVFIPDEGDRVEVFFTNEEIFCVSALRENTLAEECRKVAEKYIGNNSKQRIFLREKSLELHSDKYKILMDERGIELTVDKNSIVINKQGILLQTADSKISLAKDGVAHVSGKFELQAKDTEIKSGGKIKLSGSDIALDGSGSTNINAGSNLKLAGSKIELC